MTSVMTNTAARFFNAYNVKTNGLTTITPTLWVVARGNRFSVHYAYKGVTLTRDYVIF